MPVFRLNRDEMAELDIRLAGDGGFQTLLRRLQVNLDRETGEITLSDADVGRIKRYIVGYGQGGFQDRLARAFRRVLDDDDD